MTEIDELYLRGTLEFNTSSPTMSPTESPDAIMENSYTQEDKIFVGMFVIFPFVFSVVTGALSGCYTAIPENNTAKFHVVSKSILFAYSLFTAGFSLDFGGDKITTDQHISSVAWVLASVPVAFTSVESQFQKFAVEYFAIKEN